MTHSFLETAAGIARESGALLNQYLERRIGFELKGDYDLVTEADRASERMIVERLRSYFPAHGIVAEEGYTWFGDAFDDDVPYVADVNGKRIAVIPKLNYANDWRAWSGGLGNASTYFEGFKTSFDFIYQEALRGRAGAMDVIVHAELGGRPNIACALEQMIRYVKQYQEQVWIPLRRDVADYLLTSSNLPAEPYRPLD